MSESSNTPKLHLFSSICFLFAGFIFFVLYFQVPGRHRLLNLLAASLFILSSVLQFLAYSRKHRA